MVCQQFDRSDTLGYRKAFVYNVRRTKNSPGSFLFVAGALDRTMRYPDHVTRGDGESFLLTYGRHYDLVRALSSFHRGHDSTGLCNTACSWVVFM